MRRIMIVGSPGAGKTTLALALGQRLGLSVHHLDRMFWHAGWKPVSPADRAAGLAAVLASGAYVLEGGYPESFPARLADCDTLIWLDISIFRRFCRVFGRIRRSWGQSRPDLADGCTEDHTGHMRSFWRHFWYDRKALRLEEAALVASVPAGVRVVHLTSPRAVRGFLTRCDAEARDLAAE